MAALAWFLACACDWRPLPGQRAECHYEVARAAMANREEAAARAAIEAIPGDEARDMARLRLATDFPRRAGELCRETTTPLAREKCTQVLGRPHLHGKP